MKDAFLKKRYNNEESTMKIKGKTKLATQIIQKLKQMK